MQLLLFASLFCAVAALSDHALEIDGHSMMRRSTPPYAALEDMDDGSAGSSHFGVASAEAAASASGLLATLQAEKEGAVEPEPLGTLALLVDSDDEAEMKDLEEVLVASLLTHLKFRTPVTVLHSGPRGPAEDAVFKLQLNPSITGLSFVDVSLRVDQFAQQDARKHVKKNRQQGKSWKMNQFWALHAHFLPELQKFNYAWRLSPKSNLRADVTTDLYEVMQKQGAAFGYRLLKNERVEACAGLQNAAQEFYHENQEYYPRTLGERAFLQMYEQAECPLWSPDFQIVDLNYLRESEGYADYAKYIADIGGFATNGWGVSNVQAVFLATQEAPERMLCMTPWVQSFQGDSELSCAGDLGLVNLLQNTLKDKFSHAGALEVKQVNATQMLADASSIVESPQSEESVQALKAYLHSTPIQQTGMLARLAAWRIISVIFGLLCVIVGACIKTRWTKGAEGSSLM